MKRIIALLIIIISILSIRNVNAKTVNFYEGEYIPNIWMNKKNPYDNLIYYNQARFIRETNTNNIAYCLEPFTYFHNDSYEGKENPINYTQEQITNMTLIAHFGYGYYNHSEPKWYAITQFMLWQVAEPNADYYFSSYKNGPKTQIFQNEINEIKSLISNYKNKPSFDNKTYNIVEGESLSLIDENNSLDTFKTTSNITTIENNTLTIKPLTEGTHTVELIKEDIIYNRPILFYQSSSNQDLIDTGDPLPLISKIKINVFKTTIKINKVDKDNLTNSPQGDASLINSKFNLYKENDEYINTITITENENKISNLPFGKYYLKEISAGEGYNINNKKYYFTLTETTPEIIIQIENEVIKGLLKIKKEFGYENNFKEEQNIVFNIYNKNNALIKTIITNELGLAQTTLPYGKYRLEQVTTTEGYQKIEPIDFEITSEKTLYYELKNYKIPIPNTKSESIITKIINLIRKIICGKKH